MHHQPSGSPAAPPPTPATSPRKRLPPLRGPHPALSGDAPTDWLFRSAPRSSAPHPRTTPHPLPVSFAPAPRKARARISPPGTAPPSGSTPPAAAPSPPPSSAAAPPSSSTAPPPPPPAAPGSALSDALSASPRTDP